MISFFIGMICGMGLLWLLKINREKKQDRKVMLYFGHRIALKEIFEKWCTKNKADKSLYNLITFLESKDLLNCAKTIEYIKEVRNEIN